MTTPALVLPLRSLIRLTDLSSSGHRFSNKINSIQSTFDVNTTIDLNVNSNSEYTAGDDISISGIVGLADPLLTTVDSVSGTDTITIVLSDGLIYTISYFETFNTTFPDDETVYYFMRVYTQNGNTVNAGSTIKFSSVASPLDPLDDQVLEVYSSNSNSILFRTTDETPFGIDASYFPAIYAAFVPPNITPKLLPLFTAGAGSTAELQDTNGYINASPLIATVSPAGFATEGYLPDLNRDPLQVSHEEIEQVQRTVDGSLRYHHNATKIKMSISWKSLPADSPSVEDGAFGANDMLDIYKNNKGTFFVEIYNRDSAKKDSAGPDLRINVRIATFTYSIVKRNFHVSSTGKLSDLWDVTMELEEV